MSGFEPLRVLLIALAAALPAACAGIESPRLAAPANPFAGGWTTTERRQVAFRDDTVVVNPPNQPPTPLGAETCAGRFRFSYGRKSREALVALAPRQPDLQRRIAAQLAQPEYPVAELSCAEGGTTYVLLGDRDLMAIHRDRDIAGLQRLTR